MSSEGGQGGGDLPVIASTFSISGGSLWEQTNQQQAKATQVYEPTNQQAKAAANGIQSRYEPANQAKEAWCSAKLNPTESEQRPLRPILSAKPKAPGTQVPKNKAIIQYREDATGPKDDDVVILEPKKVKKEPAEAAEEEEKKCPWCSVSTSDMDFMSSHIQEEHLKIKVNKDNKVNKDDKVNKDSKVNKRRNQSPDRASPKRARAAEKPASDDPDDPDEEMPSFEAKKCPHCPFTAPSESQVGNAKSNLN